MTEPETQRDGVLLLLLAPMKSARFGRVTVEAEIRRRVLIAIWLTRGQRLWYSEIARMVEADGSAKNRQARAAVGTLEAQGLVKADWVRRGERPFWRVNWDAVRALLAEGRADGPVRDDRLLSERGLR